VSAHFESGLFHSDIEWPASGYNYMVTRKDNDRLLYTKRYSYGNSDNRSHHTGEVLYGRSSPATRISDRSWAAVHISTFPITTAGGKGPGHYDFSNAAELVNEHESDWTANGIFRVAYYARRKQRICVLWSLLRYS